MPPQILVGTADGLHETASGRGVRLSGHEIDSLCKGLDGWWAIIDGREVWHSGGDGDWSPAINLNGMKAHCLLPTPYSPLPTPHSPLPTPLGLLVGASEARLLSLKAGKLERMDQFEETEGRETWHTPWGAPLDVRSISADPQGPVYVNVHVGGVPRSTDGGVSWQPTIEVDADVHQVLFDPGSGQVMAASARGLAVSGDSGDTWRFDRQGLHGPYLRAVAVAEDTVLVTASTGPFTNLAAVYRGQVAGGQGFQKCEGGLPEWFPANIDTFCLAASGRNAALGTSDGRVFASADAGQTWDLAAAGLPAVRSVSLVP